jgi:prepilin-type N-terminal cleavage/methylation domain-containing protein
MIRRDGGFTLIEMLVVVGLFALLLVGMTNMMFATLRGGGKATALAQLREEGDAAITKIERTVRFAFVTTGSPVCSGGNTLAVIIPDSTNPVAGTRRTITYTRVGTVAPFRLQEAQVIGAAPVSNSFITSGRVNISSFSTTCIPGDENVPPKVKVLIVMNNANDTSVSDTFQTTITLRNY